MKTYICKTCGTHNYGNKVCRTCGSYIYTRVGYKYTAQ